MVMDKELGTAGLLEEYLISNSDANRLSLGLLTDLCVLNYVKATTVQ